MAPGQLKVEDFPMKTQQPIFWRLIAVLLAAFLPVAYGDQDVKLEVISQGTQVEVRWPAQMAIPGTKINPEYTLQRSFDLHTWEDLVSTNSALTNGETLSQTVPLANPNEFYRVVAQLDHALDEVGPTRDGEVLGFAGLFGQKLASLGQISTAQFAALYAPPTNYLDKIGWDVTQAKYWDRVNQSEFKLDAHEMGVFTNLGFVVSERLGGYSFADVFYRVYSSDLPVYVSSDAVLQAWHRTYVMALQEIEETYLVGTLQNLLSGTAVALN
jgi:hypothetical protein